MSNVRVFNDSPVDLRDNNTYEYMFKAVSANTDIYLPVSVYAYNQYSYIPFCFIKNSSAFTNLTVHIGDNTYTVDVTQISTGGIFSLVVINGSICYALPQIITLEV